MSSFRDLVIAICAAVATLFLAEIALRILGVRFEASLYEPDPVLYAGFRPHASGWTVDEGENYVTINAHGMRDVDRTLHPLPGTVRIAFLGDSVVAATQVPLERTMTQVLERRLREHFGPNVEVLNFGVGGYNLAQMKLLLHERVWAFDPQIVVVCVSNLTVPNSYKPTATTGGAFYIMSDGRLISDPSNPAPQQVNHQARAFHKIVGDLHNRIRLLQLIRAAQQADWRAAFVTKPAHSTSAELVGPAPFMRVWAYNAPSEPNLARAWDITEALLKEMVAEAHSHGAEFWLVQIGGDVEEDGRPDKRAEFLKVNGLTDLNYATRRYQAFAAHNRIHFVAVSPALAAISEQRHVALRGFFNSRPYTGHWNEDGNAAAAAVLEERLADESALFAHHWDSSKPLPAPCAVASRSSCVRE